MLKVAVVGVGFIGSEHIEAIRRTNLAEVAVIVGHNPEGTKKKAEQLNIPDYSVDFDAMLSDPSIDVVHICTPNKLHFPMAKKALEAGKHVVCEKPMTMTAAEAEELVAVARKSARVNAIHFNIRYYPLVRHAREMVRRGDIGRVYSVTGSYMQDWLIKDTDYSWRLEPEQSGPTRAVGDIGTHWMDLVGYVTGMHISSVNADMATFLPVRKKPRRAVETWSGKVLTNDDYDEVPVHTEDYASVMFHSAEGVQGVFTVNQMAAGHKNRVYFEIDGSEGSLEWEQHFPDYVKFTPRGKATEILSKRNSYITEKAHAAARIPSGHPEGYYVAFANTYRNILNAVAKKKAGEKLTADDLDFPKVSDGVNGVKFVHAVIESSKKDGAWVSLD